MKKILLICALALGFYACDKEPVNSDTVEPTLKIISNSEVWFEAEGGTGSITYILENGDTTTTLDVTTNVDWIEIISIGDIVEYGVKENGTKEERRGTVTLSYGDLNESVVVMQRAKQNITTTFYATTLDGSLYYGNKSQESYNYRIMLSEAGVSSSGNMYGDSTYYILDLYSATAAEGEEVVNIPVGEYQFGFDTTPNTAYNGYSNLTLTTDSIKTKTFIDARVEVTESGIEAFVTLENEEVHHIVYEGSLEIDVYSSTVTEGLSTLRSDHHFNIEDGVFVGAYVGDLMNTGCNTCQVYLFEYLDPVTGEERGDEFQIDLQLSKNGTEIEGRYTPGTRQGNFIPGSAEDLGGQYMQQNSWYMTAGYADFAPLVDGSIEVEKVDDETYVFTIDCHDDLGNKISGVFKGKGKFTEW
ncbi:MAG: BACON domain-containing protein [Alistipes sp.]|nr:BACON domain-containing protein [Alistipes sp.]